MFSCYRDTPDGWEVDKTHAKNKKHIESLKFLIPYRGANENGDPCWGSVITRYFQALENDVPLEINGLPNRKEMVVFFHGCQS